MDPDAICNGQDLEMGSYVTLDGIEEFYGVTIGLEGVAVYKAEDLMDEKKLEGEWMASP